MRNNKENPWTLKICDLLKKELDNNKYEVTCFEKIPYSVFINSYSENNANIDIMRYEVDLLIKEKRGNCSIPKLIIESKYGEITTHDIITYSNKAKAHKDLYSGLRYGLMIGNSNELGVLLELLITEITLILYLYLKAIHQVIKNGLYLLILLKET